MDDYFQDYNKLAVPNIEFVVNEAKTLIAKRYILAMLSKKISFKTYEECTKASAQIMKEVDQLHKVFINVSPNIVDDDDHICVIAMLSEVLKCEDEMLSFDLHRIVEKYSDITEDHLLRLLYLRGDLTRSELKEKVTFATRTPKPQILTKKSIFKQIVFPKLLVNLGL